MRCARITAPAAGGRGPSSPSKKIFSSLVLLSFPLVFLLFLSSILFFPLPARSADDVVVPNEKLVVDGIPPIPKAIAARAARVRGIPCRRHSRPGTRRAARCSSHALRRRPADPPRRDAGRRADAAHVLPGAHRRRATTARKATDIVFSKDVGGGEWFQLFLARRANGQGHDVHGRQVAEHGRRLLARRKVARVRVHAAERQGQRRLRRRPGGPEDRADRPAGHGRRLGRHGLVAGRQDASRPRVRSPRTRAAYWLVDVASGAKSLFTPEIEGEGRPGARAVFAKDGKIVSSRATGLGRVPSARRRRRRDPRRSRPHAGRRRGT